MHKLFNFCLILSFGLSFGQELAFKPKLDHPYTYDTELLVINSGIIDLGLKTSIEARFLENNDFSIKLNRIQIKSSGFEIDSKHPETKRDSTKVSNLTSHPFIFNMDDGKITVKSRKNKDDVDKIQDILKEFGKYYNPRANSIYKNIVLKENYSWDHVDSISNTFLDNKGHNLHFHYTVKDISRNHVTVHGKSTIIEDHDTTAIAVKYILDKKSGIPRYTKFISYNLYGSTVLMINKEQNFKAPGMFKEYALIQNKLNQALMTLKGFNYDPMDYNYSYTPLVSDKEVINKAIDEYLNKLSIETFGNTTDYYLSGYHAEGLNELDSILAGTYVQLKSVRFIGENGEIIETERNPLMQYYSLMQIGPFHVDYYQKVPEIVEASAVITAYKPTRRKIVTIGPQTDNSNYEMQVTDSTTQISFKKLINIDYESFQFYDAQGNALQAQWIPNFISPDSANSNEAITQSFIDQAPEEKEILYTLKFVVKRPSKISFAIFTNNLKFKNKKIFISNASK